jgi:hypothetical protein
MFGGKDNLDIFGNCLPSCIFVSCACRVSRACTAWCRLPLVLSASHARALCRSLPLLARRCSVVPGRRLNTFFSLSARPFRHQICRHQICRHQICRHQICRVCPSTHLLMCRRRAGPISSSSAALCSINVPRVPINSFAHASCV